MNYPKNCPNQTNKRLVLKLISFNSGQLQISERTIYKTEGNYKIISFRVQCRLQLIIITFQQSQRKATLK